MGATSTVRMVLLMMVAATSFPSLIGCDGDQVHHVVGEDRGWEQSSDISSWASSRIFRVGDDLWFTYSAALESVVELGSKEEFESCDLRNPLHLYTDGLDKVLLEGEGSRFFTSGQSENCKNGLKLHVSVMPYEKEKASVMSAVAAGPSPSAAVSLNAFSALPWLIVAAVYLLG